MSEYKTKVRIIYLNGVYTTEVEGSVGENVEFYEKVLRNKKDRVLTIETNTNTVIFNTNNIINIEVSPKSERVMGGKS